MDFQQRSCYGSQKAATAEEPRYDKENSMKSTNNNESTKQWLAFEVIVTSSSIPSRMSGDRTIETFDCVVSFPSTEPHRETIDNYLKYYLEVNTDSKDPHIYSLFSDPYFCAEAVALYYFREEKYKPYLKAKCEHGKIVINIPTEPPLKKTGDMAIWVNESKSETEKTEYSIAIYLRDFIKDNGKISVEHANSIIWHNFGELNHLDNNVLHAFSKIGGKYTKKYLRLY